MINRTYYAKRVHELALKVQELREDLTACREPYPAGLIRSAEEALLITLRHLDTPAAA